MMLYALAVAVSVSQLPGTVDLVQEKADLVVKLTSDINKVDHSIEVTKELIKRSPDAPYLADLYFRLAELYVEKSRYTYARIMEQRPENERSLSGEQSLEVQLNKKLAIETYSKILGDFPDYPNNDQVRFFKAHEFRELGQWDTMITEYKELIEKHPKSDWAIEARLIIADYHFDKGELLVAEEYYKGILALPESHLHDMARYKMGWIRINQDNFKEALTFFEKAVTSARKQKRGAVGDQRKLDVKKEAITAMVWPFSEVRKAKDATDYFRGLADSKTTYVLVLKKLANRYFIKTDYTSSAFLYREIVRLSADTEENIEYVQRVYDSVKNMPAKDPARYAFAAQDVDGIVKTLARFQNNQKFSEEDKGRLATDFELRARDLSTRLQLEAQSKKDVESARIAAEAYRKYLTIFDTAAEHKTMMQNRADALYQAKSFLNAGIQFEEVAKELQDSPERRDIMYSAIQSYFEAIDEDSQYRDKNPTSAGLLNKLQLVRAREGLKQLGAYYVKVWPKTDKTPQVKFNIARMYYQQGEYDRAVELFSLFIKEYPSSKDVPTAGNLAMDALMKSDDFDGMTKLAGEFVNNAAITDTKFKNEMAKLGEAARKRKVEFTVLASSEGDFSEKMLAEWEKNKGTAEGEEFLYTAFVKYKTEGNVAGVFDFGGRLIGAYPQSPKLVDVVATMGNFAVRAADFERAAFLFEEYNKRFPNEKNANEVLLSAANIRFLLGDYENAAKDYRALRAAGGSDAQLESHKKLMAIYRDAQDWEQLSRVAQTAAQDARGWIVPTFNLGLAYARQGKDQLAEKELASAVRMSPRAEDEAPLLAQAYYELGQIQQKRFDQLQFKGSANQEQILNDKLKLLQTIEDLYVKGISTGQGEWVLASAQALSRLYQEFGNFIANAPIPEGTSAADAKQYQAALAQQAQPYQAKATETLQACAAKAQELKVMSPFATACLRQQMTTAAPATKRVRGSVTGDDAYNKELAQYRAELVAKPSGTEILEKIARRAMQVGDYRLAKLTLSKAAEVDPRNMRIQNLLGVASWELGETQEAYDALTRAYKGRSIEAAANLAALFREYGYSKEATAYIGRAGDLNNADLSAPDYHPSVKTMRDEGGSS